MAEQVAGEELMPWSVELMNRHVDGKFAEMIALVHECGTTAVNEHCMTDVLLEIRAFEKCLIEEIEQLRNMQN